jgi:hypothetical protein
MPTKVTRSSVPSGGRARMPGMNSRDVTPLSITALSIIAILVVVLHVAAGAVFGHPQAHASVVVQSDEAKCPADAMPPVPSLPFD